MKFPKRTLACSLAALLAFLCGCTQPSDPAAQGEATFRADCARETGSWVTDPILAVYTGNIHCNYAHSFLTQWTYLPAEGVSPEEVYQAILPYVEAVGAQESLQRLVSLGI